MHSIIISYVLPCSIRQLIDRIEHRKKFDWIGKGNKFDRIEHWNKVDWIEQGHRLGDPHLLASDKPIIT